jgi:hypothetical protein
MGVYGLFSPSFLPPDRIIPGEFSLTVGEKRRVKRET